MKKRLLALLVVVVMLVGLLPNLAWAEETTCTHEGARWGFDDEVHMRYCDACSTTVVASEPHVDEDGVQGCDVCGLGACTHEDTAWNLDAYNHNLYCYMCGQDVVPYGPHSQEENGCPYCGSNYCAHEDFTWKTEYNQPSATVLHYKACKACGVALTYSDPHVDEDADSVCDECGATCFHENLESVEYGDHCEIWCKDCGEYVGGGIHCVGCTSCGASGICGGGCTYEAGSNVCTVCGKTNDYEYTWAYDEEEHWKVCSDCGLAIDDIKDLTLGYGSYKEAHVDADGVDGCDACGYVCPHANKEWRRTDFGDKHYQCCTDCSLHLTADEEHTLNEDGTLCTVCGLAPCDHYWRLESDSLQHYSICKYCSKGLGDDERHTFDIELGECTECGEPYMGCTHENIEWRREGNYYHTLYCQDCYEGGKTHAAIYQDDVCTICGIECCYHEDAVWSNDAYYHNYYCPGCYTDIVAYAEHSREENGCPNCGSNYCTHEEYSWKSAYDGRPLHYQVCNGCGYNLTYGDLHVDEDGDGACDDCGTTCFHENVEPVEYGDHCEIWCADCGAYVGGSRHWYASCESCSLRAPCGPECTYEEGSNVCTECGRTNDYEYTWGHDTENHWKICSDCGMDLSRWHSEPHVDADGVDGCDICSYVCPHENVEWYIDQYYHEAWCTDCGETVAEFGWHTGEGETCDVCGAAPCPETHTPSTEGDPHVCAECGITISCGFDWNGDCLCDMCGEAFHFYLVGFNDTQHRERCYMCGKATEWEDHKDEDGNGLCDVCNYGCDHENLGWYISHFNHFNWCKDCGVIIDNIADHVDADGDTTCDLCGTEKVHIWKAVAEVPATCKTEGVKAHYTCDSCEMLWLEKIEFTCNSQCMSTVVEPEDLVIPKTSHNYKDGVCTICQDEIITVETAPNVPPVQAAIPEDALLTEEEKAARDEGVKVGIQLTVENADQTVSAEDKAEIEKAVEQINSDEEATSETKIGMYLDITLTKTVGDKVTPITETGAAVTISVEVPAGLVNSLENVNRLFFVIRLHNGQVDVLEDLDEDPDTVTFETDCFSTYVLAYTDKAVEEDTEPVDPDIPATGDEANVLFYTGMMMISLLCGAYLVLSYRKRYC